MGGGAAGLEAARVLAGRGHEVSVWEAGARLGGALALAGLADPVLDRYLGWLSGAVERSGASIALGRRADATSIAAAGADEVVVATGAVWVRPAIPGGELTHVLTVPQLRPWLDGDVAIGPTVAILGGGKAGLSLAAVCTDRGCSVTVLEPTNVFGSELGLPGRFRLVADAEAAGVRLLARATVTGIVPGSLRAAVSSVTAEAGVTEMIGAIEEIKADTVIVAAGAVPDHSLADELRAAAIAFHLAGDCREVAHIEGANLDGAALTAALG